jgi:hypothetical protein
VAPIVGEGSRNQPVTVATHHPQGGGTAFQGGEEVATGFGRVLETHGRSGEEQRPVQRRFDQGRGAELDGRPRARAGVICRVASLQRDGGCDDSNSQRDGERGREPAQPPRPAASRSARSRC